jgi:hypothetical protein
VSPIPEKGQVASQVMAPVEMPQIATRPINRRLWQDCVLCSYRDTLKDHSTPDFPHKRVCSYRNMSKDHSIPDS